VLDRAGELMLARTDGAFEILWDGMFLMSSVSRAGERALGALARGRTLVGGLGMGFTLRAALDAGAASVDVAEIAEAVVRWNRGPLAPLAGRPLDDARVTVHLGDVSALVKAAPDTRWDVVLLDVDNGPSWTARPENDALYGDAALAELKRVLAPGGLLAVWSAQAEPAFAARLARVLDDVREIAVPAHPTDDWLVTGRR
jgi:spermidine synthase